MLRGTLSISIALGGTRPFWPEDCVGPGDANSRNDLARLVVSEKCTFQTPPPAYINPAVTNAC